MEREEGKRILLSFSFLIIISLGLFFAEDRGLTSPFRGFLEEKFNPPKKFLYSLNSDFRSFFSFLTFWRSGARKIAFLSLRVAELEVTASRVRQLEKENKALRKQLGAPLSPSYQYTVANVTGISRHMMIDKGNLDGIKKGGIVVFENVFIGKIKDVNPHTSLVLLASDPEAKIPVKTEKGAEGLLVGQFGTKTILSRVLQKEEIQVGDQILTLGGEDYPPHLLIGKISKLRIEERKPFKEAEVEPIFDYKDLKTVFLIKNWGSE